MANRLRNRRESHDQNLSPDNRSREIPLGKAAGATGLGVAAFVGVFWGIRPLVERNYTPDTLMNLGAVLISASSIYVGFSRYSEKVSDIPLDETQIKNRHKRRRIATGALGLGVILGAVGWGAILDRADQPRTPVAASSTSSTSGTSETSTVTTLTIPKGKKDLSDGSGCEILHYFVNSDTLKTNAEMTEWHDSVKELKLELSEMTPPLYTGSIDGNADHALTLGVDKLQGMVGIPVELPWDDPTCKATALGDGDPNTNLVTNPPAGH
ncbi:MAG: hypothetical protein JWO47_267 [Candidatus Saccharibacteria bacterium]|nr:hypothetical protein [Candidatus Saccharibacteria bacterium]